MKRLYDSSLGRLELELDLRIGEVAIWLFDEQGRVDRESGDEWDQADLPDLLRTEVGLPEPEAQSIATNFLEAAKTEGHEQPDGASTIGITLGLVIVTAILVALGVGIWTIASWVS